MDTSESPPEEQPAASERPSDCAVFPLFKLPAELRDSIYDHALLPDASITLIRKDEEPSETRIPEIPLPQPFMPAPALSALTTQLQLHQQHLLTGGTLEEATPRSMSIPAIRASVRHRGDTNLLLCNKAVRQAYEHRAKLAMTLVLHDNENYTFQSFNLPPQVKQVHTAELHIILFCHHCATHPHTEDRLCQAAHEVLHHRPWIEHLLNQLNDLRYFTIQAYLCFDKSHRSCEEDKDKAAKPAPCEKLVKNKLPLLYSLPKIQSLTLYRYNFNANPKLDGPKVVMHEWVAGQSGQDEAAMLAQVKVERCPGRVHW